MTYNKALDSISYLAKHDKPKSFKDAVFLVERTYLGGDLNIERINNALKLLYAFATSWAASNHIKDYKEVDSNQILLNQSVFKVIKDTIRVSNHDKVISLLPYEYNFDDYNGKKDWSNTFVSTSLETHKGNCHSLPYLYKIIADEIGANCWLALAPNHMYIKNYSKRDGWYNTELTSGEFPIDAWLTTTGYISLKAIQNGLYCDTLSNQQAIALCAIDLAKCYEKQTGNYYDGFILQCCDLALYYHPRNVQALLLEAETLKRIYEKQQQEKNHENANVIFAEMQRQYLNLYDLGYREMPEKMYKEWLSSLQSQKNKYSNKGISK
ncbi:hypothetical protein [uncultured Flavobacterium sp.]|uniref:hypothetical protein n=1 Tax=uncultured Flavobacterium sp. TaxID=165435 RepID=UPI002592D62D|nr:hypothetical protein [uncultured Flavobacterium sp.]